MTEEDAHAVVKLIQESLFDACYQEIGFKGNLSTDTGKNKKKEADPNNIGALPKAKQERLFIQRLKQDAQQRGSMTFDYQELLQTAKGMNMQVGDFRQFVDKLNAQSVFIMKSAREYILQYDV